MMSLRRLRSWFIVVMLGWLALPGIILFVIGVLVDYLGRREDVLPASISSLTPAMQIALSGLCISAIMITLGFIAIGFLLARQTRSQAPGYGDAYRFVQQLQFSQAIPVLERAVTGGNETLDVLMLLTSAYAHTGQIARAQSTADRAVQLFPHDAGAYITLANGYRLQASFEEAAGALARAAELDPDEPVIQAELGFVYRMAANKREALEAFENAASQPMPAMYAVRVYHHLAETYREKGDIERAVQATARMMSSRDGLAAWKPLQQALQGTVYGQNLRYEIASIEQSINDADAASTG
ncbi:MAG: tetratricopeptide repeat protein [Aggregatilineales bacterium]